MTHFQDPAQQLLEFQEIQREISLVEKTPFIEKIINKTSTLHPLLAFLRIERPALFKLLEARERINGEIFANIERVSKQTEEKARELDELNTYLVYSKKMEFEKFLESRKRAFQIFEEDSESFSDEFNEEISSLMQRFDELLKETEGYNAKFVKNRKKEYAWLWEKASIKLDENQLTAIIRDDHYNLVVAGAGSGKTEVLVTRIAYLLERKPDGIAHDRILALAFQNKAAAEMRERLKKRFGVDVKIKTFHALGREILQEYAKSKNQPIPKLKFDDENERDYTKFIDGLVKARRKEPDFQNKIINFMKSYGDEEVILKEVDFKTKEEYYNYLRKLRYTTLDGTKVKSEAEREIMNFFITHNLAGKKIRVLYQDPANWMEYATEGGIRHPKPDFFLPDFDIYIEHWAIGKNGKVPEWFEDSTAKYTENMKMKKDAFKNQDKYLLIESTNAEYQDGLLLEKLSEKIVEALEKKNSKKAQFEEIGYEELVNRVWEECRQYVGRLSFNISNYIKIAKTYDLSPERINKKLSAPQWSKKQTSFAEIALEIYVDYDKELRKENEIDFPDMINLAVRQLKGGAHYQGIYDHILIDEFQDISLQRFNLITGLLEKNDGCKLFCVGDDWQSIMGFAGSNLDLFTRFNDYFDHPSRTDLEINYRSIKSIVDTGVTIIKNNGSSQLSKITTASNPAVKKIEVFSMLHQKGYQDEYYKQVVEHCAETLKKYLKNGYSPNEILVLCRIVRNPKFIDILLSDPNAKEINLSPDSKKENAIRVMSVHGSKGLQARLVILLNVDDGLYGFPCKLENPDVFETAIEGKNRGREEEERRLFYVAVTRAKEDLIIYTQKQAQSKFIDEIAGHTTVREVRYQPKRQFVSSK